MARPIRPRENYAAEIRSLTTLRAVVMADQLRGEQWRREACAIIDSMIRHLTEPPGPNLRRAA